jgi:hypothetical protein
MALELMSKIFFDRSASLQIYSGQRDPHLYEATVIPRYHKFTVVTDISASSSVFESADGLDDSRRLWAVNLNSGARRNGIAMRC